MEYYGEEVCLIYDVCEAGGELGFGVVMARYGEIFRFYLMDLRALGEFPKRLGQMSSIDL